MFFSTICATLNSMKSRSCVHGKQRNYCRDCEGTSVCTHGRARPACRDCRGSRFCIHLRTRTTCKICGTHRRLLLGGFTPEEIKEMGARPHCQFPGCYIQCDPLARTLNSDHTHTEVAITPENYRGEICTGCNVRLKSLDEHPEWATPVELAYMTHHPYSRKKSNN